MRLLITLRKKRVKREVTMPSLANGKIGFVLELVHFVPLSIISNGRTRAGRVTSLCTKSISGIRSVVRASLYVGAVLEHFEGLCSLRTQGGFNLNDEADGSEEKIREERPICRDRANMKASSSTRYESSSITRGGVVELVADKWKNNKSANWGKKKEKQNSYIQLKNRELDL
nr:hypothetical protein [Tanacetum cinerariifolium]